MVFLSKNDPIQPHKYVRKLVIMLENKVEKYLKQKQFSLKGKGILVGVSGGPDSLALLNYLWERRKNEEFLLVVSQVDHMFRGEESYEDAKFVEEFCKNKRIPFTMKRINVPQYMKESGKSSQVAARECRYQFFAEVINEYNLDYLALAHHGDDQVETILMRLTRGSSGSSRAGIPFSRPFEKGLIIPPFLCVNRGEIESYCREHRLQPRQDPSNKKDDYLRNRFRKYVVSFLKKENPNVHEHFQRFSEELYEDEEYLRELTKQKMNTVWKEKKTGKITIDIDAFQAMPMALQRRGIQLILNYLYQKRPASLSAIHIDYFFSLIESSNPSGSLDFPSGLKVNRSYRLCHFLFSNENNSGFYLEISEPGKYRIPNGDAITVRYTKQPAEITTDSILLKRQDISLPIIVRTKEEGDRMSIKGMEGTKKIKKIFIDQKIPIAERQNWPVITDGHHHILWLPTLKKYHGADSIHHDCDDYIVITYQPALDH